MIDRLEELLDHSTRIPLTNRVVIDEDEYLRLIDQLRISVPQEVKNARQIEVERDKILAAAQEKGERMIAAAQEQADKLVDEHAVRAQAENRAHEVMEQAYAAAAARKVEADDYALQVLEAIAEQLDRFGREVEGGIRMLAKPQTETQPPPTPGRRDEGRPDEGRSAEPRVVAGPPPATAAPSVQPASAGE